MSPFKGPAGNGTVKTVTSTDGSVVVTNPNGPTTDVSVAVDVSKYLPLTGGTMTGPLILSADPTTALGAATKEYADTTIPHDALVASLNPSAWWKLSDPVGSTTAADSSGNGYTGTVTGGVTFGQPGAITGTPSDTAALFDGTSGADITTTYNPIWGTSNFTIGAWIKSTVATRSDFFHIGDTSVASEGAAFFVNSSGHLELDLSDAAGPVSLVKVNDGNFHSVFAVNVAGSIQLYIDGSPSGSPVSMSPNIQTGVAQIGVDPGSSNFAGTVAQVAIFPTALTPSQISALYNAAPKYGEQTVNYVTTPTIASGTAFTPSITSNTMVTMQLNAAAAGSYSLTMGSSTGAEITIASTVAMVSGSDELVTLVVPRGYRVILTLVTATVSNVTVITNPA